MRRSIAVLVLLTTCFSVAAMNEVRAQSAPSGIDKIETVVVIYAENRSFDNLYGNFRRQRLADVSSRAPQTDRDGTLLKELPPVGTG